MTAPVDSKFSLFQDAGDLIAGDIVVGLRGGVNSRFTNTGGVGVFLPLLGGTMLGAIDMGGFKITNLDTPTNPADAVTKTYADLMLPLAGGTMSGVINMNSHKITNLTDPTSAQDAATKAYVDSTGSGTVSPGLINQLAWYAAGGSTVSGLTIANSASLVTNGSGVPAWQTLTAGQILIGTTDGAPAAAAINSGSGILVGNASGSITVNLAAIADHTLLANISGGSAAPSSTTLTALIDNAIGNTQGNILYRNGSVWTVLAPSTSGFALVTGGPAANPAWAAVGAAYTASALSKGDDTNVTLTLTGTPSTALLQATTITAGWTGQLGLTRGGTASSLTASNGGIVYSTASALAILGGTATANLPLLSGSSTTPSWGSFALSLGGALTTAGAHTLSGAFASTFTFTNTTTVTFPTSGTLATTAQLPSPAALSKADDTNVTLTLTGTPTTALLQATTITAGWTGQLGLTRGGTAASLTADNGGILYSTASALAIKASTSTAGLALLSGSSTTPTWSTLPPITKVITQTFNGNGTYTPTAGMKYCIIEVLGSGAGGGGVAGTIAQAGAASGGGAGGYAKGLFTAAQVGATAAVTVGAAGAAGTSGNNNGGNGNTSSVALTGSGTITIQATGGTGGLGSGSTATFATQLGQNGGVGSNGDLNVAGQGGGAGFSFGAQPLGVSGPGGSSIYGAGGLSNASGGAASAGVAGRSFGSGGSGAASGNGTSAAGGAGTIGIVYITEYVSI